MYIIGVVLFNCRRVTFLSGEAGVYALGAVVAHHNGDKDLYEHYVSHFKEVVQILPISTIVFLFLLADIRLVFFRLSYPSIFQMNYYMGEQGFCGLVCS